MKPIDVKCQICGRKKVIYVEPITEKLAPLFCCDECYNRRTETLPVDSETKSSTAGYRASHPDP